MSFKICRDTLGSLAMFTTIRNALSRISRLVTDRGGFPQCEMSPIGRLRAVRPKSKSSRMPAGPAECSLRAAPDRYCCDAMPENPVPGEPIIRLLPYVSTLPLPTAEIAPAALSKIDVLLTSTAALAPLA